MIADKRISVAAAIVLILLIYYVSIAYHSRPTIVGHYVRYPLKHWFSDNGTDIDIPGGHPEEDVKNNFPTISDINANIYDFLYNKDFQDALDRAAAAPRKKIVLWHPKDNPSRTLTASLGRNCGFCHIVNNVTLIDDNRTEAVVFLHDHVKPEIMPTTKRNPEQYWIWRNGESPSTIIAREDLSYADKIGFNLTMSFRPDSDIRAYYGRVSGMKWSEPDHILQNKKHLALIVVTDCSVVPVAKLRMQLIRMLMHKGLTLTTSGGCFPHQRQFPRSSHNELLKFTSQHKFYLAFENSYHCRNYVTEKFFRTIKAETVPVVWGARKEDYLKFVPESGFIFVEDYPNLKDLIRYLNYLDRNDTAYLKYFEWRTKAPINSREMSSYCQVCRLLHGIKVDDAYTVPYSTISKDPKSYVGQNLGRRRIESVKRWWLNNDNPDCLRTDLRLNKNGNIDL